MKRILFTAVFLSIIGIANAQQESSYPDELSLFERVTNVEKKTDRFNFLLNMQHSFDARFNNEGFQQGSFMTRQFRIEAKGNINEWLSYRWRQRLNKSNDTGNAFDNMPASIDWGGIGIQLSDQFSLFAGKQAAAYGSTEFDLNPIEIYEYSDMIEYGSNFFTGIKLTYDLSPTQQWQFQVLNALNNTFESTYSAPDIEKSKLPLMVTLNWNGNLFDGIYKTRWSGTLSGQAKGRNQLYLAFGNNITFSPKANMFLDVIHYSPVVGQVLSLY